MKLNLTILCLVTDLEEHGSRLYDEVNWMKKINASEDEVGRLLFSNGRISTESKEVSTDPNPSEDYSSESPSSGSEPPRKRKRGLFDKSPEPEQVASEG
ncbi:hypothetical protein SESBI_44478 [Sesbania bispinosa]|nr:hypothetical protein SESBI_44478 [Sesbania bispinosa]